MPNSKQPTPPKVKVARAPRILKTASERQTAFVQRKREAGYVQLSGVFVPAAARAEAREAIKNFVAEWEEKNAATF